MKPVPVPCGTSNDVPVCPNGTAVSFVTCTVAGPTLSTTLDTLPARAVVLPLEVVDGVEELELCEDEAVLVTLALLEGLSACFDWSLSDPLHAISNRET